MLEQVDATQIRNAWDHAHAYNKAIRPGTKMMDGFSEDALANAAADYHSQLNLTGDGIMGYIKIPSIRVDLPIYHGTEDMTLEKGVGHLLGTSLPVGGESTHTVLTGHSGMAGKKMFSDVLQMQVGDVFYLEVLGETIAYQVDQIKTVLPHDTSYLGILEGQDHCTLVTCTPFGINTHRLLVRGIRIETIAEKPMIYVANEAFRIEPLLVTPAVAAPMVLVFLIHLMVKYREPPKKKEGESDHAT